jgi:hypothetical protein
MYGTWQEHAGALSVSYRVSTAWSYRLPCLEGVKRLMFSILYELKRVFIVIPSILMLVIGEF